MAKGIRRKIHRVMKAAMSEIKSNHDHGNLYARGLSGEGYAGGYLQALSDVLMALDGQINYNSRYSEYWEPEK